MVIFARTRVMTDTDSRGKLYHYLIKSSRQGKSLVPSLPSPDGGAARVPHTPEGAQEGNLLGPSSPPGAPVLGLGLLLLVEDPEGRDTAAPAHGESVG